MRQARRDAGGIGLPAFCRERPQNQTARPGRGKEKAMDWTELIIEVPVEAADTAADIANMAVPYGIYVEDYSDLEEGAREIAHIDLIDEELLQKDRTHARIHIYISAEDNPAEALAYLEAQLDAVGVPHTLTSSQISESDWADNWKQFFKCTEVGEKLVIRPSWETYTGGPDRTVLDLDPGAAFGTGTHATTRLCLELLEQYAGPGRRMLDIGCGSGILSIAAALLGCEEALGVDIDPLAVKVAKENAARNHMEGRTAYLCGDLADKVEGEYDILCANIVADVIIRLAPDAGKYLTADGVFICSGIIDIRAAEVEEALAAAGFSIVEVQEQDNWRAYAAKRA